MEPWSRGWGSCQEEPGWICQDCVSRAGEGDKKVMVLEGCSSAGEAQASLGVLLSAKVRAVPPIALPCFCWESPALNGVLSVGGWAWIL